MADNPYTDAITMVAESYKHLLKNKTKKKTRRVVGKAVQGSDLIRSALAEEGLSLAEFRRP